MKLQKLLENKTGIELAIFEAGSAKALSKATGINHGELCLWKRYRVIPICSHEKAVKIEKATGIDRKRLCPDLYFHKDTTDIDVVFKDKSAIDIACFIVGGKKKLASMLGVKPYIISFWLRTGQIYEKHIAYLPYIERMSGIDRAYLFPSRFGVSRKLIRQKEAVKKYNLSIHTLHRLVRKGELTEYRTAGGHRRYYEDEIQTYNEEVEE